MPTWRNQDAGAINRATGFAYRSPDGSNRVLWSAIGLIVATVWATALVLVSDRAIPRLQTDNQTVSGVINRLGGIASSMRSVTHRKAWALQSGFASSEPGFTQWQSGYGDQSQRKER
jgi:hypothetical protein